MDFSMAEQAAAYFDREREARQRAERDAAADRKAVAKREAIRVAEEAAALAATQREQDWEKLGAFQPQRLVERDRRWHIHNVIDCAFESDPPTAITWLQHGRASAKLIGETNAISLGSRAAVATFAITTIIDADVARHEIGHQRTPGVRGRLEREVAAWDYCITRSPYWEWQQHAAMGRALSTYLKATGKVGAVLGVVAAERLMSRETFERYHRPRREEDLERFEDRLFFREHGFKPCAIGKHCRTRDAFATTIDLGQMVCRDCASAEQVNRQVRWQRWQRERRR